MSKQTWTIKYLSEFVEPYYNSADKQGCRHQNSEEWDVSTAQQALQVTKDFLDVPVAELSIEEIRKDFEEPSMPLPEKTLVAIQNYYNGRLALWNTISRDIEEFVKHGSSESKTFKYDIPAEYNSFEVYSDGTTVTQNMAYIEINFKNS